MAADVYNWQDPDAVPGIKASIMSLTSPNNHLGFMFSGHGGVIPYKLDDFRRALVNGFSRELTLDQLLRHLAEENPEWDRDRVMAELNWLMEKGLLEPDKRLYGDHSADRYDRQLNFLGIWSPRGRADALTFHKRLQETHVVLIGIGGFGSHILCGLSHMGVGRITAVDCDQVQASNLNRQILFEEKDVGHPKIWAAEKRCKAINSQIDFKFIHCRISGVEDLESLVQDAGLVVFTADSPRQDIFSWMNQAAFQNRVPVIFTLGVSPSAVLVGPLVVPGITPCLECTMPPSSLAVDREPALGLNRGYFHGTIEPYLMAGAGLMLNEITAFLTRIRPCRVLGAMLTLDMAAYTTHLDQATTRPGCQFCGDGFK